MVRNYIGLIHKDPNSDFGVSFPDFPGIATAGTDLDGARAMAEEALQFHVDGLLEDGETIPEPSSLDTIMSDPENRKAVALVVSLKTPPTKAVRVNITLNEEMLTKIDFEASKRGLSRSGFLALAAHNELENGKNIRGYALSA